MKQLNKSLSTFWSSFGIPAYLSGNVPDGSAFPYITFECVDGSPFTQNMIVAQAWFRSAPGYDLNDERATLADAIKRRIVPEGIKLAADEGFMLLYPDTAFL